MSQIKESPKRELRQFGRRQKACHAMIEVGLGQKIPCIVKDLSSHGALLEFCGASPAASKFFLMIEHEKFYANCDVRHRQPHALSVRFSSDNSDYEIRRNNKRQTGRDLAYKIRQNIKSYDAY